MKSQCVALPSGPVRGAVRKLTRVERRVLYVLRGEGWVTQEQWRKFSRVDVRTRLSLAGYVDGWSGLGGTVRITVEGRAALDAYEASL